MGKVKWSEMEGGQRLSAFLDEVAGACTVSASAQRVMELTRAGEVNLSAVTDAVMKDPSLAAELIRLANSPLFGQAKEVSDLKRAVVVVGMQELHNIAAAMSMMAAFAVPNPISEELRNLSVLSAAVARLTARSLGMEESTAFLSGLLAEIGAMACIAVDTAYYTALRERSAGDREARAALEKARYSAVSEEIGYYVLNRNRLPEEVAAAVRNSPSDSGLLGRITGFARRTTPMIVAAAETADAKILQEDVPRVATDVGLTGLSPAQWTQICVQAAVTAELSLRGEALLSEELSADQESSSTPQDPAAFEMSEIVYAETQARKTQTESVLLHKVDTSIRFDGKERGFPIAKIISVAAAAALAGGAAYWFYFAF